jgi:hypothetical protein
MKQETLFEHKKSTVTYEEIMVDVEKYQNLLEPPKKPKKTPDDARIKEMYNFYHKLGHLKGCHWNPKNPNNKLKEKKSFGDQSFSLHKVKNK